MPELPTGTVTFLFTDIEGSTRLLRDLGAGRYGELLSLHNRVLREAVVEVGGIDVDRQGDSIFAVFRSAGAAVAAAVAGQRAIAAQRWPGRHPVRVRMGIHTGEATLSPEGYVGVAVHQASRVGDAGHGGQILLSSTAATLVEHALPAGVTLRDLGEVRFAGFDRPEHVFQVCAPDLATSFPPVGQRRMPTPAGDALLEREAELVALQGCIELVQGGSGRVAVIEGRAGMGKTRLVAAARAAAGASGMAVLAARGGELEHEFAYGVVRQVFEPLLASASADERAELLSGAAALCARLFDQAQLEQALAGESDVSFSMLHGLYWLSANTALRRPTMIAIDDLHWADGPSLRWLLYLLRRVEELPLLLVVASRPPEQSQEAGMLMEIFSDPGAVMLRPGPLSVEAVEALARERLGAEPDRLFSAACHEATGGNPLLVRALTQTLAAEGITPTAAHAGTVREIGPEAVSRAVALRLSRLPDEGYRLARAVAVLGDGCELHQAAALADLERDVAAHAATTLARVDILRLQTPLEFVHPVVRAAVYDSIGPAERSGAHRRAAALLAVTSAEPEQSAAHLLQTAPAADPGTVAVLRAAAARSLARGSAETAVAYLRRALEEPPVGNDRIEVVRELGMAERRVDTEAALRHLDEAVRGLSDPVRRGETAVELGRCLLRTNRHDEAIAVFEDALERLGEERSDLRDLLEAELIGAAWWVPRQLPKAVERLAGVREDDLGRGSGAAVMLASIGYHEARTGHSRRRSEELTERAVALGHLQQDGGRALYYAGYALTIAGRPDDTARMYDVALADARRRGDLVTVAGVLLFRSLAALYRGDVPAADEDLRESRAAGGFQMMRPYQAAFGAQVLMERGQLDDAEETLAAAGLPAELPVNAHLSFFRQSRQRLLREQGRVEEAIEDAESYCDDMRALQILNPAYMPWRSDAALALHLGGRDAEARRLAAEELEQARAWGVARPIGVALRVLGIVEGGGEGMRLLEQSVEQLAASPARLEHARSLLELGAARRAAGDRGAARDALRQAAELALRCGATAAAEAAQRELAATGARPRRLVLSGVEALTPSERRVAEMASGGMTNKDIAQALFVTAKTVEVHLSSVYRKLGISSRAQLGDTLGEVAAAVAG